MSKRQEIAELFAEAAQRGREWFPKDSYCFPAKRRQRWYTKRLRTAMACAVCGKPFETRRRWAAEFLRVTCSTQCRYLLASATRIMNRTNGAP